MNDLQQPEFSPQQPGYLYGEISPQKPKRTWPWIVLAIGIFAAGLIGSCVSTIIAGGKASDEKMVEVHRQMDAGDCSGVYTNSSDGFRKMITGPDWQMMCEGIHRKMGAYQSTTRGMVNVNKNLNGSFVVVQYSSKFSAGDGSETFTWKREGDALKLYGYNIQSKNFLENIFK